jgi:hypothetical protein
MKIRPGIHIRKSGPGAGLPRKNPMNMSLQQLRREHAIIKAENAQLRQRLALYTQITGTNVQPKMVSGR